MKFLLAAVNAKYIHSNPAVYSLYAYAGKELQSYIELAEYTINERMEDILADLYARSPQAVGFSCYIWNWKMVQELIGELPKLLPAAHIWLGGPEVSFDGEAVLKQFPQVTGIMVGEGEETFRELLQYYVWTEADMPHKGDAGSLAGCEALQSRTRLQEIPGLCLQNGLTPPRKLADISRLPFIYRDLAPFSNRIIYYESSRGCPYRCSYCLSSVDKRLRLRDIGLVTSELQFFLDRKVPQVKFIDRTFNCSHEHAMAVWQYLYEHDNGITNFHFEIAGDILREDEIALLNRFRPGLAQLEIGVQSVNSRTLAAISRRMDLERLERNVALIRRAENIHLHLDLIAGLPYEDYESFRHSFDRVYAMEPEQLQLGFLKVLKGSEMHDRAQEFGICYLDKPPYEVLYTKWLSYQEVLRLKGVEEMLELYYNSGQFAHTLAFLGHVFESPFALYEALADFYREKGYFANTPARAYRYQVLLEFIRERDAGYEAVYRELLTFDMYLRENVKSRPDFASDVSDGESRGMIRKFYQQEEKERKMLPGYGEYNWKQMSKMTHLEPFVYPVWDREALNNIRTGGELEDACPPKHYVLFDYCRRSPLTYAADIRVVPAASITSSAD